MSGISGHVSLLKFDTKLKELMSKVEVAKREGKLDAMILTMIAIMVIIIASSFPSRLATSIFDISSFSFVSNFKRLTCPEIPDIPIDAKVVYIPFGNRR